MKRLLIALAAAAVLAVPGTASAMVIDPGGGGGGGGGCTSGILYEGNNSGYIPYFGSNSFVRISVKITNVNVLGVFGSVDITTYPQNKVSQSFTLFPRQSITIAGPTYTTPVSNTRGVPFNVAWWPGSDAYALGYTACA
jgi:hypothetical protein